MLRRISLPAVAIAALVVPVLNIGIATPVAAHAHCGSNPADMETNAVWPASGGGANQRTGSSTTCGITGTADVGERLDYHCYTADPSGQTWTYLRNDYDNTYGWVRDDLLADNGSQKYCGF